MGPTVKGLSPALFLLLAGILPAQIERGVRVPVPRARLEALAPTARTWPLFPEGLPGGPSKGQSGLEGLLARRVRREPLRPAGPGRAYGIHVQLVPEGSEIRVPGEDTLTLRTGWAHGPQTLRVLFWTEPATSGGQVFPLWHARLAEGLTLSGLGGRDALVLDGDGDGQFATPGKDVLFLEETGWPSFPLTEVVLFATGAYVLSIDQGDWVEVSPYQGPLGVLRLVPEMGENPGLSDVVVGTGRVFRILAGHDEPEPVTPGVWHLLAGRMACGLAFQRALPPGGLDGASVLAGQEGAVQCGAPFTLDVMARDQGDRLTLYGLKVSGRTGEVYFPDASGAFQGEPLSLVVEVMVGRTGKERSRLARSWAPWKVTREEGASFQPLELRTPGNWAPLQLRLLVRGGPLGGAQGSRKVR